MKRGAAVKHHDQKQLTEEFILAYIPQRVNNSEGGVAAGAGAGG